MPLFWLSLAFLAGVVLGERATFPVVVWLLPAGLVIGTWLVRPLRAALRARLRAGAESGGFATPFRRFASSRSTPKRETFKGVSLKLTTFIQRLPPLRVLLLCLAVGAARYQAAQPRLGPDFIAWYNDTGVPMAVVGVVVAPPDGRDTYINLRLQVERVRPVGELIHTPVHGLLLARAPPGGNWRYGDRLVLQGELETPPEGDDFSYRDYLARQGITSFMPDAHVSRLEHGQGNLTLGAIYNLQARALAVAYRIFPDPEASLLAGILLGVETGIPRHVQQAFKDTGTSHVIAISGFNITILAGMFVTLFGRLLGPRWGALAAVLGIAAYTVLVGADAAVVRAALMGGLSLFARQVGRRGAALNSLAFTGALMALSNPQVLWQVGFQLSFAATLGLVLYADPLAEAFARQASRFLSPDRARRLAGPVGEYCLFTLAAQLTTLPVSAYHFQRLSLSSLLANPAILPVQPALMVLAGLAVILGLVYLPLGHVAAWLAWPLAAYTIRMVEFFAALPGGVLLLGQTRLWIVILFYSALFAWTGARKRLRALAPQLSPSLVLGGLALLTVLVWRAVLAAPDGRLHLTVLDVGQGDALLVQTPHGRYVLIDGGPRASLLSEALGRRLPPGRRRLDWLVVAAPHAAQVGALPTTLPRFPPAQVLWAGAPNLSREARLVEQTLTGLGVPMIPAQPGQMLDLGAGARLEVLATGRRGAVLLLVWERFRALLPVGLDFDMLESLQLARRTGPVSMLLLAEGGYAPLNSPAWIANLQPELVVISVAAGDREGLPSPEVLEALMGYTVLRTDRHGWVEVTSDGQTMRVRVEKGGD